MVLRTENSCTISVAAPVGTGAGQPPGVHKEKHMINMRHETRTRFVRWQVALLVVLLISLTSASAGKRKQAKERDAAVATSRFRLGSSYLQDGDLRRCLSEFLEAVRLQPREARFHNGLGQVYFFLNEYDLAEEHLRRAIKLNPGMSEAHHNLALLFSDRGDYAAAEESYLAALADPAYLTPEKVYLNWGKTLQRKGEVDAAEKKIRKALEVNPLYIRGYRELGRLLEDKGEDAAALEAYLKAYLGIPEHAELNLKIGELYLRQGSADQARRYLQKVIDTAPPESSEALRAHAFLQDLAAG
ncbi:MAG: tetratricopeptide repeat protein [Acidobacteria bacterium]|nr:MAG: tetratricopeptide repeat protein [Acidobacteriota bacterium]